MSLHIPGGGVEVPEAGALSWRERHENRRKQNCSGPIWYTSQLHCSETSYTQPEDEVQNKGITCNRRSSRCITKYSLRGNLLTAAPRKGRGAQNQRTHAVHRWNHNPSYAHITSQTKIKQFWKAAPRFVKVNRGSCTSSRKPAQQGKWAVHYVTQTEITPQLQNLPWFWELLRTLLPRLNLWTYAQTRYKLLGLCLLAPVFVQ